MSKNPTKASPNPSPTWKSYWRLTRIHLWPAGTILFFWPCMWALTMCGYALGLPPRQLAIQAFAYLVGCTIRHNAACIWNDICDREFDRQVERTKSRPIASGSITVPAALLFLAVHCFVLIAVLALAGQEASKVGLFGLLTFEMVYPLSKRFTNWPQAWLGEVRLCLGISSRVDFELGVVCWTIHFDTIYACQDKEDDVQAGVHSCALLFGNYIRPILALFAAAFVGCLAYAGHLNGQSPLYFVITVLGTALHLIWQLSHADLEKNGGKIWKSNGGLGYLIWGGMISDYTYKLMV
ncbi:uncharacterized protein FIBRA_03378 [Fibroporia radiculosa]|uniref:Uncharacterized protein n=1 Tax=Fibroporia radiculosa TaxID=599839 RepID=J4H2D4_9APHY|nr:uncharacterized protein FIBRA_03378 [Fibroporia radiculosa]CCM01329.1 predicted protein [Fibroporia radiculosa]